MMKKRRCTISPILLYLNCRETSRKDELCYMKFNLELPGLKGVNIEGIVEQENRMVR